MDSQLEADLGRIREQAKNALGLNEESQTETLYQGPPILKARAMVRNNFYTEQNGVKLPLESVYVVWFAKTLQNWKALVSTDVQDGKYYEVTHNGDKNETYIDQYSKTQNLKITT